MKAVKEVKTAKVSTYVVTGCHEGNHGRSYCRKSFEATTAQEAVDFARQDSMYAGAKIVEVAKVVDNWK